LRGIERAPESTGLGKFIAAIVVALLLVTTGVYTRHLGFWSWQSSEAVPDKDLPSPTPPVH
jgi:hypothetical protein